MGNAQGIQCFGGEKSQHRFEHERRNEVQKRRKRQKKVDINELRSPDGDTVYPLNAQTGGEQTDIYTDYHNNTFQYSSIETDFKTDINIDDDNELNSISLNDNNSNDNIYYNNNNINMDDININDDINMDDIKDDEKNSPNIKVNLKDIAKNSSTKKLKNKKGGNKKKTNKKTYYFCDICNQQCNIKNAKYTYVMNCGHVFHKECIDKWKLIGKGCPMNCELTKHEFVKYHSKNNKHNNTWFKGWFYKN